MLTPPKPNASWIPLGKKLAIVKVERVVKLPRAMGMERAKATKAKVKLKAPRTGGVIMGIFRVPPTNHGG